MDKSFEEKKICSVCKEDKSLALFVKDNRRKSCFAASCKECSNTYKKSWAIPRREEKNSKERERYWKDREPFVKTFPHLNNPRLESVLRARLWRKKNPAHYSFLTRKYKISKKGATPSWLSPSQLEEMRRFYELTKDCEIITGEQYHVDHIHPLQGKDLCGLHVPWNLQVLPSDVNRKKSNYVG